MAHVVRTGILCSVCAIGIVGTAAADLNKATAAQPATIPSRSSELRHQAGSRQTAAVAPNATNPLRAVPAAPTAAPTARDKSSTLIPVPLAQPAAPLVPNTGSLRLFRTAEKPVVTGNTTAASEGSALNSSALAPRGNLFPQSKFAASKRPPLRVMRFADVAQGAAVVPVTAPQRAQAAAPASAPKQANNGGNSPDPSDRQPNMWRLPPPDRTAPRPTLTPGTKLPQEPIKIYPETGM